ncbi:MAG TPA: arylamine N-acetyltransferase [Pyrinomonadaceae bacterium]|nr:arylamine N-acetyltransferase [Pyrinomonadaceae bacterium]
MDTEKYLRRIGIESSDITANAESLRFLQKQHLLNVPFENLDIHWKRPILLDTAKFYQKIVEEKRGGFCYELNGLFCQFLNELGFPSKMVSARVADGKGGFSAEYDHMAILTRIDGTDFLVDVGFGDFTAEPLNFVSDIEQKDENGTFLIRKHTDEYFEVAKKDGDGWKSEYIFKAKPRDLAEFTEMCNFHQTSPESHFTRGKVCSLMLENGRKTLTDKKFIETRNGAKSETEVNSKVEFNALLAREFQIKMSSV